MLLRGPDLFKAIKAKLETAEASRFAIAFWGNGAMATLGLNSAKNVEIICNLDMGGTNPDEIVRLIRAGAAVYSHPSLHAKFGVVDNFGFLGSSNASANGLAVEGAEARSWEELNVAFEDEYVVADLITEFERLKAQSKGPLEVTDDIFQSAKSEWLYRQSHSTPRANLVSPAGSFIAALKADPERFRDGFVHLAMHQPLSTEDAKEVAAAKTEVKRQFGSRFDVYTNWRSLPKNTCLIDFLIKDPSTPKYGGIWLREPNADVGSAQAVLKLDRIQNFNPLTKEEVRTLTKAVKVYWEALPVSEQKPHTLNISDLAVF